MRAKGAKRGTGVPLAGSTPAASTRPEPGSLVAYYRTPGRKGGTGKHFGRLIRYEKGRAYIQPLKPNAKVISTPAKEIEGT